MAPLVEAFPVSQLSAKINTRTNGKPRKPRIEDLSRDCELKEMVQYQCKLAGNDPSSRVECWPTVRLFRQCANGLTVETTSWEGVHNKEQNESGEDPSRVKKAA